MKPYSLTRRLIVVVLLVEFASALALTAIAGVYEGYSRFHAFDVMLRGRADSMLGAVQDAGDQQDNVMLDGSENALPRNDIYIVRDARGQVLGKSPTWAGAEAEAASTDGREFRTVDVNGRQFRVIREVGLRVVDPGEHGGTPRRVTVLYGSRTHAVWEAVEHGVAFFAAANLLLLVVTGLVMFWMLGRGLQPLRELAAQAGRVSVRSWEFVPSPSAREVQELAPLVGALETALHGLERSFAQQTQFVSDAAHELKTSVAVLKSSLQVLTMRTRSATEYEAGLDRLQMDCARMEDLVASMLTLAGLEAEPKAEDADAAVELGDVVREVAEQFRTLAEVAGLRIEVRVSEPIWVNSEREPIRLLCSNLIHNALQHGKRGGEVRVLTARVDGSARLRVEDDGAGILPEVLPRVFDRFYRADPSRSRRTGGTGLGLAISKAIVTRLQGRIWLESCAGRGTSAVVSLPCIEDLSSHGSKDQPSYLLKGGLSWP